MPVAEADPFSDLVPNNLIGGEDGAPAFQTVGGRFEQVPRAEVNTPTELGAFADLIPTDAPSARSMESVGPFDDLVPKPKTETEKALAETPNGRFDFSEISAKPTFFNELQEGRLGSAYYLAKEFLGKALEPGQKIEPGRGKGLLGTEEQIPKGFIPPGMDPLQAKLAIAVINVFNRTAAGLTGPGMLPLAVIGGAGGMTGRLLAGAFGADMASHAPDAWKAIQEADKTEPWSQERFETGLDTVMQALMMGGAARHAATPTAPRVRPTDAVRPASEPEASAAAMERPVDQTRPDAVEGMQEVPMAQSDNPAMARFQEARSVEGQGATVVPKEVVSSETVSPVASNTPETQPKTSTVTDANASQIEPKFKILEGLLPGGPKQGGHSEIQYARGQELLNQGISEYRTLAGSDARISLAEQQHLASNLDAGMSAADSAIDTRNSFEAHRKANEAVSAAIKAKEIESGPQAQSLYNEVYNQARVIEAPSSSPKRDQRTIADITQEQRSTGESSQPESTTPSAANARAVEAASTVPENLRRNPEVERLLSEPEAQTGPQMKMAPATEGGALGFGGGKRATVTPKGTTPRGDTEFLRIEPGYKRAFKGLERKGAADVIGETKNKVGTLLADATRKHVDIEQELFGRISTELSRPIRALPKKVAEKAFDEVSGYLAAKENGRPLPTISAPAQGLVTAWENIADKTGKIAQANGVQVFDPATNSSRPMHVMGRQYVPRMFKAEVEQVMRDPNRNPKLWNDLVTDFANQRGIPEVDAANQLRGEAGKFSANDFMGNLEMARTGKMPESFYEYDLRNLAARYIPNFSERMAQIIAYGQRLGPRESPKRPNLWDIARKEAGDSYTQEWLNNAENQAVNLKMKGSAATGMARAQTAASGLLLSSPTTTVMRNILSGVSATPELLGVRRSIKGFADTIKSRQARMDAREIGTVRDNIADFLHADRLGDSPVDNAIRSVVDAGLKYSGYNGSEVFVRTHGTATAAQFAKDAVAAIAKKPKSMRSKEALGLFQRTGVDAAKIVAEGADWRTGPETRKFIRTFVRDTQGGYRFDQVPLWANSNAGRFFYQFGRWGTQRARNIWNNGVKPALGENVEWHGKTMTRRDIRPLVKMLAGTVVLGETFAGIAQLLFGRDRRDASLSEIAGAWKEDERKAVGLAMQRMMNDVIMAGTLGIWSQPIDWAKSLKDQSRLKNPTEPPGLGSLNAFAELAQDMLDQGGQLTKRDLLNFAASLAPGVKQATDVARNVIDEPLYEAENDVKTLRNSARRWADQAGLDVSPRAKGDFRKSALAPEYEPIKEALLVGDAQRAKFLSKTFFDKAPDRSKAIQSLKASIRQSQPFRAGPYTAKVHRDNFKEWARKNLNEDDYKQTQRIQERYQKAATAAGLW